MDKDIKYFKVDGLNYYIKAKSINEALYKCWNHKWGISSNNLIKIERIPSDAERVI